MAAIDTTLPTIKQIDKATSALRDAFGQVETLVHRAGRYADERSNDAALPTLADLGGLWLLAECIESVREELATLLEELPNAMATLDTIRTS